MQQNIDKLEVRSNEVDGDARMPPSSSSSSDPLGQANKVRVVRQHSPRGPEGSSSTPAAANDINAYNENMVWIKGFPHDMMSETMKQHAATLLDKFAPFCKDKAKFRGINFKRQYSIEFESKVQATSFRERATSEEIHWLNPRNQQIVTLRCQTDKSITSRVANSVPFHVYSLVKKHLQDSGAFKDEYKLGNTGTPRKFFIIDEHGEGYVLFTIQVVDPKTATIEIDYDGCTKFGISKEIAELIAKEATQKAMQQRQ